MAKRDSKKSQRDQTVFLDLGDYQKLKRAEDNTIAKMIGEKTPGAYREIEKRYQKKLFTYIYHLVGNREEAEDILQNVFVKMYNNIKRFDTKRKFSSWIYRIAHNEAVNFLKRKSKKQFVSWEDITVSKDKLEASSKEISPVDSWIKKETKKEVQDALNRLPGKYREALVLRYFLDKSYEEISEILGKPINTVGTLINRAKKKLSQVMKEL